MARKTKEEALATRSCLIDAAEQVFLERGVSQTSLHEVAKVAGTSRGAIYWHFKDKAALFDAMMDRVTLPMELTLERQQANDSSDPLTRLRDTMSIVLKSMVNDARACRVFEIATHKVEYAGELLSLKDRQQTSCKKFQSFVESNLRSAAKLQTVRLPMSAEMAARGLHAMFSGLIQDWFLNDFDFDIIESGRKFTDTYLRGLGLDLGVASASR